MVRIALLVIIVCIVVFGPQLWTRRVFAQHSVPRPDYPGTGAELARHLLDRLDMKHIKVEMTEMGDHYDPATKTVRLMPDKFSGKSLTAVTVAAHEVGHAIQDHTGYQPLAERTRLVRVAHGAEKVGGMVMMGIPIAAALAQTPVAGVLVMVAGMATMGISSLCTSSPFRSSGTQASGVPFRCSSRETTYRLKMSKGPAVSSPRPR